MKVVARGAALDQIGRDRERGAGEADQRHTATQRAGHRPHGLEHEGHGVFDVDRWQRVYVGRRAHGTVDHRAFTLGELEPHAERLGDQQDVGEQDRGVDPETLHRLERDLGGSLGIAAQLEEGVARAQGTVFRQIAAGLAHEPHGRERRRLAPRGAQER